MNKIIRVVKEKKLDIVTQTMEINADTTKALLK
jgi:hypothetical protein